MGVFSRGQWRGEARRCGTRVAGRLDSVVMVVVFNDNNADGENPQCRTAGSGEVDVWREERNGCLRPAKVK